MFIVMVICLVSFLAFGSIPPNSLLLGKSLGMDPVESARTGYIITASILLLASFLRMWAGSILTSRRIMAFKVQKDLLNTAGPYALVRNPIYLADLVAFCGFALCLNPVGLALPLFIFLHYAQLVRYEEKSLEEKFGEQFKNYRNHTPAFIPTIKSFQTFFSGKKDIVLNWDGFRHNSLYLLFIPGFLVASRTGLLLHAILIGLPAVIDWAIVHTRIGVAPSPGNKLAKASVFGDILYAQCWEDPEIDREAFQINDQDVIFTITSGGCNALAFLLDGPSKIISLDLNPSQNYLLDLKMAAFRTLDYDGLLGFIGVRQSDDRLAVYHRLRAILNPGSRIYWDQHEDKIVQGIIHAGRYEKYMHLLSKWFRRLVGKSLIDEMLDSPDEKARKILYDSKWNTLRWRLFTKIFLSRSVMTLLFDRAFFKQLADNFSFGKHFRSIVERAVTSLPVKQNPFLQYILKSEYSTSAHLPLYLRPENFKTIQNRLDRIELVSESCEDYFKSLPANSVSKFNFTNIFEWMPRDSFHNLLRETVRVARQGSILTYRNLLVTRSRPSHLSHLISPLKELSRSLHEKDLSFIYRAYIVERVTK
ncbi:MAG: hypothetical protein AMS26_23000 [Bacteroides sp. SM23_62]|nr:MAG: hypothetical protein AMS26_23000 [Bacteroides sp. SM23_62]